MFGKKRTPEELEIERKVKLEEKVRRKEKAKQQSKGCLIAFAVIGVIVAYIAINVDNSGGMTAEETKQELHKAGLKTVQEQPRLGGLVVTSDLFCTMIVSQKTAQIGYSKLMKKAIAAIKTTEDQATRNTLVANLVLITKKHGTFKNINTTTKLVHYCQDLLKYFKGNGLDIIKIADEQGTLNDLGTSF